MNNTELQNAIEKAFSAGQNQQGLGLLRELNSGTGASAQSLHRQAVIEEQIGDWQSAGRAHKLCIQMAPQVALGYLYAGSWLLKNNNDGAAAALFSLAQEADPLIYSRSTIDRSQTETANRMAAGYRHLTEYLSFHHREFAKQLNCSDRILNATWVQTHDRAVDLPKHYSPQIFFIPDLPQTQFREAEEFEWTQQVLDALETVKKELKNALQGHHTELYERPYLDEQASYDSGLRELAGSLNWTAIDLFRDGEKNDSVSALFPHTLELVDKTPSYKLNENPYEAFFSVLKPGQVIKPHYGLSNHSLTVHLALDIPEDCYLEVNSEQRRWSEHPIMIFDDNFLHAAHNKSKKDRVVFIFSIWHPDLNADERSAVIEIFKHRQLWMKSRTSHLTNLP